MHSLKLKFRLIAVVLFPWLLVSCITPITPKITKRYRTHMQVQVQAVPIEARLTAFSLDIPNVSARTTLLNLLERGQASLIEQLGAKSKDAADLLAKLGTPIKEPKNLGRETDHTVFARRVVFSIDNLSSGPADRISTARIKLKVALPAHFNNWTQFATKYETADLGSLKFTQNREIDLNTALTLGELATLGGQAKTSNQLEENLKLTQRYISVTGMLSDETAELIQQGAPGIDVTGNIAVDFTVQIDSIPNITDTFSFSQLFDDKGKANSADQVRINRQTAKYVKRPKDNEPVGDIMAKATLNASIRHVTKGDRTFMEGDDRVEFRVGATEPVDLLLVPKEWIEFSVWMLRDSKGQALNILFSEGKDPEVVQLASFDEAVALLAYLAQVQDPASIGGRPLTLSPLSKPLELLDATTAKTLQVTIEKLNWGKSPSRPETR